MTAEQWVAEHPGEVASIRQVKQPSNFTIDSINGGYWLNNRFQYQNRSVKMAILPVYAASNLIVDVTTNEVLVELKNSLTWYPSFESQDAVFGSTKLWMYMGRCGPTRAEFYEYEIAFRDLGGAGK